MIKSAGPKEELFKGQLTFSKLMLNYKQFLLEIELLKSSLLEKDKEIKELRVLLKTYDTKIITLEEENSKLKEENSKLQEQLYLMQHLNFGKKSEANISAPTESTETNNPEEPPELQTVSSYTRVKNKKSCGRLVDTKNLLRHKIYHDLSEEEKTCKCCNNILYKIGEDVSEQLELFPAKLYVVEHVRSKYCCRTCNSIVMSPKPTAPIPKSLAGASLITDIIINKYQYHLPLYRQTKILKSYNVFIPDNTLGNLVMQAGRNLMPIYEALWESIINSNYLQVDETPVKILNPDKKGYLWTYFAPLIGKGLVIYELALTRESQVVENRLADFKGLLQTDGYSGYNGLKKSEYITSLECMSHVRRKYYDVIKVTKNNTGIAAEMLEKLKPLYALESKMRENGVSFHTRKRLREKYAKPLLREIYKWLNQVKTQVPPKSKLMEAIKYTLNTDRWKSLNVYLRHGKAEIDNNWIENKNRPIGLGRRNWLFMGNEKSGIINALLFTLTESALINNLNPRIYIHYLLTKSNSIRQKTIDIKTLLPHTIDHTVLKKFAAEQMNIAKEVFNSISTQGKDNDFNFLNIYSVDYTNKTVPPEQTIPAQKKKSFKDFSASIGIKINDTS